jgi:hypothetical protein
MSLNKNYITDINKNAAKLEPIMSLQNMNN